MLGLGLGFRLGLWYSKKLYWNSGGVECSVREVVGLRSSVVLAGVFIHGECGVGGVWGVGVWGVRVLMGKGYAVIQGGV